MELLICSICYGIFLKVLILLCWYCMRIILFIISYVLEEFLILCGRLNRFIFIKKKSKIMYIYVDNFGFFIFF